jgi:hypothetical protein
MISNVSYVHKKEGLASLKWSWNFRDGEKSQGNCANVFF